LEILEKYQKQTTNATNERDGMLWLWEHNVPLDNVIYYSHTGRFAFGWRSPLAPEVRSRLLEILSEFPGEYDFAEPRKY
jgi:hypothetical protein